MCPHLVLKRKKNEEMLQASKTLISLEVMPLKSVKNTLGEALDDFEGLQL